MPEKTLAEVATLLEEALEAHKSVRQVVLSTREGVVVASVGRDEELDSKVLSTISAALVWAGSTALDSIGSTKPRYLIQSTRIERILTILEPNYFLVVVISKAADAGADMDELLSKFQSVATRMELLMTSTSDFGQQTTIGRILEELPEISQAMLLTEEGMPLGSVGFEDPIELAGLASSIFSNGLTFSPDTDYITMTAGELELMVARADESRLVMVACRGQNPAELAQRVRDIVAGLR
ncbi:MAG: hypothetical protein ACFFD9_07260 [Candidatus Thorarchaeota archaeon]